MDCPGERLDTSRGRHNRRVVAVQNAKGAGRSQSYRATSTSSSWTLPTTVMSKHRLSPIPEPPAKRQHTLSSSPIARLQLTFDSALYDELILSIFAHLSWADLCVVQRTNKNWARLSSDNQVHNSILREPLVQTEHQNRR